MTLPERLVDSLDGLSLQDKIQVAAMMITDIVKDHDMPYQEKTALIKAAMGEGQNDIEEFVCWFDEEEE